MKLTCKECDNELEFEPLDLEETEIFVKPCKFCMDALDAAINESSYDSGYDAGYDTGHDSGYDAGYTDAKIEARQEGYEAGYEAAKLHFTKEEDNA